MRLSTLAVVLAALTGTNALALPASPRAPDRTVQCIAPGGQLFPKACNVADGRLPGRERLCTCPEGGVRVEVAACTRGQKPPGESKALESIRRDAMRDGTLIGDTMNGKPICASTERY